MKWKCPQRRHVILSFPKTIPETLLKKIVYTTRRTYFMSLMKNSLESTFRRTCRTKQWIFRRYKIAKTTMLQIKHYWLQLGKEVDIYITKCDICQKAKSAVDRSHGLFQLLGIPSKNYIHTILDFITALQTSTNRSSVLLVNAD